jgi:hypothetical protein
MILNEVSLSTAFFFLFFLSKGGQSFWEIKFTSSLHSIPLRLIFCESVFVIQQEEEEEEEEA